MKLPRVRYHQIRIVHRDGTEIIAFQDRDTSGRHRNIFLASGRRYLVQLGDTVSLIDQKLHSPPFARIDWKALWNRSRQ